MNDELDINVMELGVLPHISNSDLWCFLTMTKDTYVHYCRNMYAILRKRVKIFTSRDMTYVQWLYNNTSIYDGPQMKFTKGELRSYEEYKMGQKHGVSFTITSTRCGDRQILPDMYVSSYHLHIYGVSDDKFICWRECVDPDMGMSGSNRSDYRDLGEMTMTFSERENVYRSILLIYNKIHNSFMKK